eukprot:NODE_195_length_15388_cov_0.563926.p2 type:complete len:1008 gc:universal NODE_195_length_15388_cov_0.563926:5752-8775(+)
MFDVFDQQLDLKAMENAVKRTAEQPQAEKKQKQSSIRIQEDHFEHNSKHSVRHVACVPNELPYKSISDYAIKERCRTWEFELDPFQEIAIRAIDREESVLVAAHTSAGKTVTAEYAIAKALRDNQRVVYTSPIKALSNQKYRDFKKIFNDVGLMTGDNLIDPSASCLVMTTEILRSMFYLGSEVFREVSVIIFDEVHYLRDKERGVVWEESILLAPKSARFVFLSATIPNAAQFASWIANTHDHICHVVYTDFRPVPLTHYIYPLGGSAIYNVYNGVDFNNDSFQKAMKEIENSSFNRKKMGTQRSLSKLNQMDENPVEKIVKLLTKKGMDPIIMFCFSKRDCESYAVKINLDFNVEEEKDAIDIIYSKAMMKLEEQDRLLPQVESLLPILQRGIGIHHSGMLPILKEIVEILFGKGLIKVLFATETFSIGLNMPARTCCFTGLKKFDGKEMRLLSSGEWIQMSGRAGRRGLDDQGLCVMMIDEHVESDSLLGMITGEALPLNSAFRLTYHMLLNLSRVEGIDSKDLLKSCFMQYQKVDVLPQLQQKLSSLNSQYLNTVIEQEDLIRDYCTNLNEFNHYKQIIHSHMNMPNYCTPFLTTGRVAHVVYKDKDFGWGIVCGIKSKKNNSKSQRSTVRYEVDVVLRVQTPKKVIDGRFHGNISQVLPALSKATQFDNYSFAALTDGVEEDMPGVMVIVPCYLDTIHEMSTCRVQMPESLIGDKNRKVMHRALTMIREKYAVLPLLDVVDDLNIVEIECLDAVKAFNKCKTNLESNELLNDKTLLRDLHKQYTTKSAMKDEINQIELEITDANQVISLVEHDAYLKVLKQLNYVSNNIIETKGRVACEISAGDAVLITELIFNGFFNQLSPEVIVAVLSCVVFAEKYDDNVPLPKDVQEPLKQFQETIEQLTKHSIKCGLNVELESCLLQYRTELVPVAYAWSKQVSFVDICKMTDVYEGSIVRMFRRLDELLRQMHQGCMVVGNTTLAATFDICSTKIRRGIVFTESLYL